MSPAAATAAASINDAEQQHQRIASAVHGLKNPSPGSRQAFQRLVLLLILLLLLLLLLILLLLLLLLLQSFHWGLGSLTHATTAAELWRPGVTPSALCGGQTTAPAKRG
jgi:uncharacterized BrkB/YihY/UPF0761 family membrane protein